MSLIKKNWGNVFAEFRISVLRREKVKTKMTLAFHDEENLHRYKQSFTFPLGGGQHI